LIDRGEHVAAMERRIGELEGKLSEAEADSKELAAIRARFAEQSAAQERASAEIAATKAEAGRITESLGDLAEKIDGVLQLRSQIDGFAELNAKFTSMHDEASSVRAQVRDVTENLARLRTVHDDVSRAHKHTTIRLDGLDQRHQTATNKMDVLERRAESSNEALESLLRLASGIPNVQHQLGVLKATADQVFRSAVEAQRGSGPRTQYGRPRLAPEHAACGGVPRDQTLIAVEGKLADVQTLHTAVLARSVSYAPAKLDEAERDATRAHDLREEIRASTQRSSSKIGASAPRASGSRSCAAV
jgi:hypothetical protein